MGKDITFDAVWVAAVLFSCMGLAFGWYIVRLDHMVEDLRREIIKIEKDIGKLQNADITCTNDQTILKQDMSAIRETMLKMVARRFMRKGLRKEWGRDGRG